MKRLTSEVEVEFREEKHQYFRHGIEYISQSKFVKIFEEEFDKGIVHASARAAGLTSEQMQRQWDDKRDQASQRGNVIHKVIEDSWYGRPFDGNYQMMVDKVRTLIQPSQLQFPEKILYLDPWKIAGTADLPSQRCILKGRQVVDIFDYKTNIAKGITLYKSQYKDGQWKHYGNSHFLGPIGHLESSLYNKYALQLSLYMFMVEYNYGALPGRMGILHINSALDVELLPVPYLKREVESMLDYYSQLKPVQ